MPRRPQKVEQPKRLEQKSLDTFFSRSSSPAASISPTVSPPRPKVVTHAKRATTTTVRKRGKAQRIPSDNEGIPSGEDDGSSSSDPSKIRFERQVITVSSSDEEIALSSPRVPTRSQAKKRKQLTGSGEDDDNGIVTVSSSDEDHIGVPVRWKGKATQTKRSRQVVDSDEEEELPARRRKLVKGIRPPTPEEEDILAEVDENSMYLVCIANFTP